MGIVQQIFLDQILKISGILLFFQLIIYRQSLYRVKRTVLVIQPGLQNIQAIDCLLYTSDAADD